VFRLARPALLRITIVRVYPTCKVVGAFTVRARAGANRIPFRGRFRGRPLPAGGYRLIVRAQGASRDAAAVPIVIARSPVNRAALRKARSNVVCTEPIADFDAGYVAGSVAGSGDEPSGGGVLATVKDRIAGGVDSAAGAVSRTARGAKARIGEAAENPNSTLLTVVGLFALLSAILGGVVLARLVRLYRYRQYYG
jgi:hypothetical protein